MDERHINPYVASNVAMGSTSGSQFRHWPTSLIQLVCVFELVSLAFRALGMAILHSFANRVESTLSKYGVFVIWSRYYVQEISDLLLFVTGIPVVLGMLLKRPWVARLGWIYILAISVSLGLALWTLATNLREGYGTDMAIKDFIRLTIRLAFFIMFYWAFVKFKSFMKTNAYGPISQSTQ